MATHPEGARERRTDGANATGGLGPTDASAREVGPTALPQATFSGCDDEVEARMARTTEEMLACLANPDPLPALPLQMLRLEHVSGAEIRAVIEQIAALPVAPPPALAPESDLELVGVLLDCCRTGSPQAAEIASQQLLQCCNRMAELTSSADRLQEAIDRRLDGDPTATSLFAAACEHLALRLVEQIGCSQRGDA